MYRRRRPPLREVTFSFDSFLDLVANVCGIIIRLILVAWVGARTYHSAMESARHAKPPEPPPKASDDPLSRQLAETRSELEKARSRLMDELKHLRLAQVKSRETDLELAALSATQQDADREIQALEQDAGKKPNVQANPAISAAELAKRQADLLRQIKDLEQSPAKKKVLRFRTPLSKPVSTDELMFECQAGRVTFIDLPALLIEVERKVPELQRQMERLGRALTVAGPVGAFRLQYAAQRQGYVHAILFHKWVVEPIASQRGETLEQAVRNGSNFRQVVDSALPDHTVITFWVYPDSFGLFRQLRDLLYQRGLEVAGRPLPDGIPIMGSSDGTASRGQ